MDINEDRFLKDVEDHSMSIIKDDDAYRHLSFSDNGSSIYRFDLHTWPGELCITGDCGTYVFRRTHDMFEFFRADDWWGKKERKETIFINPGYWGEKLLSIGTNAGYEEFDEDSFRDRVKHHFDMFWEDEENEEAKSECWHEIQDYVLSKTDDGEHFAYNAAYEFHHKTPEGMDDFYFQDFFDSGGTNRHTFCYLWCLYAIAWGIQQYDAYKDKQRGAHG